MQILGYHLDRDSRTIVTSNGDVCKKPPYIEFLLKEKGTLRICYNLDFMVSNLLKVMAVSNSNLLKLYETSELKLSGYKFKYVPKKFFSIEKEDNFIVMADASQYMERWDLIGDPLDKAKEACKLGGQVYNALSKLGLHPKTLVSPISAFDKEIFSKLNLPDFADIPPEASEYAYNCCHGPWVAAFQTGRWNKVYDLDVVSAYPFELTKCIDTRLGTWIKTDKWEPDAFYGYAKGIVSITSDFSPIIYSKTNEMSYTPKGEWETFLNKKEIEFIKKHDIGDFQLDEAWWFFPEKITYPLKKIIEWLYTKKETSKGMERKIVKRIMCFSPDTEVWTEHGIKNITNVKVGDRVYSVNPSDYDIQLKPVIGSYEYKYCGDMYHICNDDKYDFLVTPEHNMVLKPYGNKPSTYIPIKDILQSDIKKWYPPRYNPIRGYKTEYIQLWDYVEPNDLIHIKPNKAYSSNFEKNPNFRYIHNGYITTREHIKWRPSHFERKNDCKLYIKDYLIGKNHDLQWRYKTNDFLELMGWYLSEGHLASHFYRNTYSHNINITNTDIQPIIELLNRMEIPHSISKSQSSNVSVARFSSRTIYNYLLTNCGQGAKNKRIPPQLFKLHVRHLEHLYKTMMLGDGTIDEKLGHRRYTTISPTLAESFQRLCLHLGIKTRIFTESPIQKGRYGKNLLYRVAIHKNRKTTIYPSNVKPIPYDGKVYCITVQDNHTVLAGRNGKFEYIGQSGMWGRTLQVDFGETAGEYFNSVWGCEVEVGTRLEVARFILDNNLIDHVIHIAVDGVLVDKEVVL